MTESPSLEALISRALEVASLGERSVWLQAAIAAEAEDACGVSARAWASEVGCSATWVRQLKRTHRAFPDEDDRCPTLSFAIHNLCAHTDDPAGWLARAEAEAMSWADLKAAIKGDAPARGDEEQLAAGERIVQRLRRWGESAPKPMRQQVAESVRAWLQQV